MEVTLFFFFFSPKQLLWLFCRVLGEGQGSVLVPVSVVGRWEQWIVGYCRDVTSPPPLLLHREVPTCPRVCLCLGQEHSDGGSVD